MIFFTYFLIILMIFFESLHIIFSLLHLSSQTLPISTFYCVYTTSDDVENDTKLYSSRGAGAYVFEENKIALALFFTQAEASKVKNSLDLEIKCEIVSLCTPALSPLDLSDSDNAFVSRVNTLIPKTLATLCALSIELDSHAITEANLRVTIEQILLNLNSTLDFFLTLHPDYFSSPLAPSVKLAHSELTTTISWLNYLTIANSYTDNLTLFTSVVRNTTLNLIFAIASL